MLSCCLLGGNGGLASALLPFLETKYQVTALHRENFRLTDRTPLKYDIVIDFITTNLDKFVTNYTSEEINSLILNNIQGSVFSLQRALPSMIENNFGRYIYISSVLSKHPLKGTSLYSATKSFNETLIKTAAKENAKYNITCNSIALGYFDGGLTYKVPDKILTSAIESIPLKRLGKIEELFNAINFIVDTQYFTGATLELNGGL